MHFNTVHCPYTVYTHYLHTVQNKKNISPKHFDRKIPYQTWWLLAVYWEQYYSDLIIIIYSNPLINTNKMFNFNSPYINTSPNPCMVNRNFLLGVSDCPSTVYLNSSNEMHNKDHIADFYLYSIWVFLKMTGIFHWNSAFLCITFCNAFTLQHVMLFVFGCK